MLRERIALDEKSDADALLAALQAQLNAARLDAPIRALITAEVRAIVTQFLADGRKLSALGSQFNARREINGDGYSISIAFRPQASKGWLSRLLGR